MLDLLIFGGVSTQNDVTLYFFFQKSVSLFNIPKILENKKRLDGILKFCRQRQVMRTGLQQPADWPARTPTLCLYNV